MKSDINDIGETAFPKVKDYFNIVLIGDPSVGKTSILKKYINNAFEVELKNEKVVEIYTKKISFNSNSYKLKFWDITKFIGNNDISKLDMFYNCDGIIFVSSYDSKSSLENLNIWYQLLIEYIDLSLREMVWLINKKDLNEGKVLTEEQIEKKSKDLQLDYYEVSAKTGENIACGIKRIIKKLIKRSNDNDNEDLSFESSTIDSSNSVDVEKRKNCIIF
jgi:small GTP-binding protein